MNTKDAANKARAQFSSRLLDEIRNTYHLKGATELARQFNHNFPHLHITSHAARKWLVGESIPTQEKIIALAKWLKVDPWWLRYGSRETYTREDCGYDEQLLVSDVLMLKAHERRILQTFLDVLLKRA